MTQTRGRGWRNRPLVREPDVPATRSLWRVLGALTIALSPLGIYLVLQNQYLEQLYELSAVRAEQEALRKEEEQLRVERTRLESYARIESWALETRGLVSPSPDHVIVLPVDELPSERLSTVSDDRPAPVEGGGERLAAWVAR
jgi:hypothetical protein